MKNIAILSVLVSALVLGQSCAPKSVKAKIEFTAAESNVATTKLVKLKTGDEIVVTQDKLASIIAENEAQRKLAISEKTMATATYKDASGKIVYYKSDVDPSYTGGFDELRQNLKNSQTYSETAREKSYQGTVIVDLFVD